MIVPNFVIIGAMKAATTSLASALAEHPEVCMAQPKEPMFFSHDERWAKGWGWYDGHFDLPQTAGPDAPVIGEASTSYSRRTAFPDAAKRLAEASPGCRLVYVLRHPVDRAYSHYVQRAQREWDGAGPVPGFDAFVAEHPSVADASAYGDEIDHVCRWFDRSALFLMRFEDVTNDNRAMMDAMCAHIGVDASRLPALGHENARDNHLRIQAARDSVDSATGSGAAALLKRVVPKGIRPALRRAAEKAAKGSASTERLREAFHERVEPMGDGLRGRLLERFGPTVDRVASETGWDLSAWRE